jgi:hypothetical protein
MRLNDLPASGYEETPPDPRGTATAFQRMGYELDQALADLIDNSIDAQAKHVRIRLVRSKKSLLRMIIADDGAGMSEDTLRHAMQYGVQAGHDPTDLGKYGIGMKAASFSQCQSMTVITRQGGALSARRWTYQSISKGWHCEVVRPENASRLFQDWGELDLRRHGTLVVWDDLDWLKFRGTGVDEAIANLLKSLPVALGMTFHRFLKRRKVSLAIDVRSVEETLVPTPTAVGPLDPFGYEQSGDQGYPLDFWVDLGSTGRMKIRAHIWQKDSPEPGYKLGGGKLAARQGFYFYRNDRLIQAGGWSGLRENDAEPHSSLARVEVNLPPEMDSAFGLSAQKSRVVTPVNFISAVRGSKAGSTTFPQYLKTAEAVYRRKREAKVVTTVPGQGLPAATARKITRLLINKSDIAREISMTWEEFGADNQTVFKIDRDNDRILLNAAYRSIILQGARGSGSDAPIVKSLLFLLVRNEFDRQRSSSAQQRWLAQCNQALLAAIKASR